MYLYSKMMDLKVSFADFLQAQKKPEKVSDGIRKGRSERFIDGNELAIGMRSIMETASALETRILFIFVSEMKTVLCVLHTVLGKLRTKISAGQQSKC